MKKIGKIILWAIGGLLPLTSLALVYQYDPASRLASIQSTYPGGVEGLYHFCADKLNQKMTYLNNLGVSYSPDVLKQESQRFLASCIYGEKDYQQAECALGGSNCTPVDLPIDLSTLKHLSGADNIPAPATSNPASFLDNLY
jgi:hypothetical protein